jgi:glycosyltransferase involved in cell wall biosynthesis
VLEVRRRIEVPPDLRGVSVCGHLPASEYRPGYGAPVLVVVDALAARTGGGLTYLRSLLPAASAADPELQLVVVVTHAGLLSELTGVAVVEVPSARSLGSRLAWEQTRLAATALDLGADLIFSPSEIAPLRSSLPVVLGFQNPNLYLPPLATEPLRQRLRFRALLAAARTSAKRARSLIFVSDAFRRMAEPHLPRTDAPRHTVTVGIDGRFVPNGDAGRFEALRPYVLCVADIYAHKALPVAVEAFARVAARRPDLRLVLAGHAVDARESARVDACIRRHGLDERVTRLDTVPYEDMPSLYRGASCFVFPSLVESLGLPPLEALACGVPVVAAAASVLPDVLDGAVWFFPPGDVKAAASLIEHAMAHEVDRTAVEAVLARHDRDTAGHALAGVFRAAARN